MESAKRPQKHAPNYNLWTVEWLLRNSHDEPSGCRVWDGSLNKPGGYGRISYMGKGWRTHRLAYLLLQGPIPEGMDLLHSCDNPHCINPNHLRPGTHAENIKEAYTKGRKTVSQGSGHPRFSFTAEQAQEIVASRQPAIAVAAAYGVHPSTVYRLRNATTWKSLNRKATS